MRMSSPATSSGFRLEAPCEFGVADSRAEIGEQAERLAQAEDRLLGPQASFQRVVLPVADGAEQHGVGGLGKRQRRLRQGMAVRLVGSAADQGMLGLERQVEAAENAYGLGDDLDADAVAGQDRNLHDRCNCRASQGCFNSRSDSNALILSA